MDDIVDSSKITIANDIQMLRPTWSTSSLPKRCNQDPQFASSVAAGGPSDDNGSLLLQSFVMVIVM